MHSSRQSQSSKSAGGDLPKKLIACEACRRLKAQCTWPTPVSQSCERCLKVRNLMLEIEGIKDHHNTSSGDEEAFAAGEDAVDKRLTHQSLRPSSKKDSTASRSVSPNSIGRSSCQYPDGCPAVVLSGVIALQDAYEAYEFFKIHMLPQFPVLVIPLSTEAGSFPCHLECRLCSVLRRDPREDQHRAHDHLRHPHFRREQLILGASTGYTDQYPLALYPSALAGPQILSTGESSLSTITKSVTDPRTSDSLWFYHRHQCFVEA